MCQKLVYLVKDVLYSRGGITSTPSLSFLGQISKTVSKLAATIQMLASARYLPGHTLEHINLSALLRKVDFVELCTFDHNRSCSQGLVLQILVVLVETAPGGMSRDHGILSYQRWCSYIGYQSFGCEIILTIIQHTGYSKWRPTPLGLTSLCRYRPPWHGVEPLAEVLWGETFLRTGGTLPNGTTVCHLSWSTSGSSFPRHRKSYLSDSWMTHSRYGRASRSVKSGSLPPSTLSNSSWTFFWISGKRIIWKMKLSTVDHVWMQVYL